MLDGTIDDSLICRGEKRHNCSLRKACGCGFVDKDLLSSKLKLTKFKIIFGKHGGMENFVVFKKLPSESLLDWMNVEVPLYRSIG